MIDLAQKVLAAPIPFSIEMARALADGRKTQTRRIVNPQPDKRSNFLGLCETGAAMFCNGDHARSDDCLDHFYSIQSRYWPGDLLWVREPWQAWTEFNDLPPRDIPVLSGVNYLANGNKWDARCRHARSMPRWASRMTLHVTDVRLERLQDITNEDARAEGIDSACLVSGQYWRNYHLSDCEAEVSPMLDDPVDSFRSLWESIYGHESWGENPYVWRIKFDPILRNVGEIPREAV